MFVYVVLVTKVMVLHVDMNVNFLIEETSIDIRFDYVDSCLENATICSSSAACVYDPILQDNVCSCRDGFVGDGIQ